MLRAPLAIFILVFAAIAAAEPPPEVLDVFRDAADALAAGDPAAFLGQFDKNMSGYAALREEVEGLLQANDVSSAVEVVTDAGDDTRRMLELDWLLSIDAKDDSGNRKDTRRKVLKCTVERRGRHWKITALEPVGFFRYQ